MIKITSDSDACLTCQLLENRILGIERITEYERSLYRNCTNLFDNFNARLFYLHLKQVYHRHNTFPFFQFPCFFQMPFVSSS